MELRVVFGNLCQGMIFLGKESDGVEHFDGASIEKHLEPIASLKPDLLGCAEILLDDEQGRSEMAETFSQRLGLPYVHTQVVGETYNEPVKGKFYGNALMSRYPILKYDVVALPNPDLEHVWPDGILRKTHPKYLQKADLELPDGTLLTFFNLHSYPVHRFGTTLLSPELAEWREEYVRCFTPDTQNKIVITGDFNNRGVAIEEFIPDAFKDGALHNLIKMNNTEHTVLFDRKSREEARGMTHPEEKYAGPNGQVDYILASCDIESLEQQTFITCSDHPLLFSRLKL